MPSLNALFVNGYLRHVMKPKRLDLMDPPLLRQWAEARAIRLLPKNVARERATGPSVQGEWQRPRNAASKATILYIHGGGYVFGSVRTHRSLTMPLAAASRAPLFSIEYRLAPEHPCPAAIEDAVAAFDWLVASGRDPKTIIVAGDSAGGGLALAMLQALKSRSSALPAGAILYSPWTDLAATGASMAANAASDAMFQQVTVVEGAGRYAGRLDRKDPRVSPLYGDLAGLPTMLVFASRSEMLYDDAARLVDRAILAGVKAQFEPRDGLAHVWPLFHPLMPESKEALVLSAAFIRERMGE